MIDISKIDKNFAVSSVISKDNMNFYNVLNIPFKIYGVFFENSKFRRLPETIAKSVSDGVYSLHDKTAGGRVRFKTDSQHISIITKMHNISKASHFPLTGTAGLDLYTKTDGKYNYEKTFVPPYEIKDGFESTIDLKTKELRDITINLPLYSGVSELLIGIDEGSVLLEGDKYINEKPIVFYGSSITQGGCASRPGNSYQGILSRKFDFDYINLGFSGNAKGEIEMAKYIASLDMSIFVYDYDHNAPTAEFLANTHERMFLQIREKHPNLPIIIMSRPQYNMFETSSAPERRSIIETTYLNAKKHGDNNVYFIDGPQLMAFAENNGTVDDCHPTDLGFMSMAKALEPIFEKLL